jgi:Ni,Fe-hydrogenase I small subunit
MSKVEKNREADESALEGLPIVKPKKKVAESQRVAGLNNLAKAREVRKAKAEAKAKAAMAVEESSSESSDEEYVIKRAKPKQQEYTKIAELEQMVLALGTKHRKLKAKLKNKEVAKAVNTAKVKAEVIEAKPKVEPSTMNTYGIRF